MDARSRSGPNYWGSQWGPVLPMGGWAHYGAQLALGVVCEGLVADLAASGAASGGEVRFSPARLVFACDYAVLIFALCCFLDV